jgi:hypothetical protein
MASISAQLASFARKVVNPGAASIRTTRAPKLSLHQVNVVVSDASTNTVHVQFNGTTDVTPGIQVMHMYSATNPPVANDTAYGFHNGTDFIVVGRLVIPASAVTLP